MILRSLLFVFPLLLMTNHIHCLFKKVKDTLDNYVIDLLFTNCVTVIRCNPYEIDAIVDISIEKVGYVKCSNKKEFLPADHIKNLSVLSWTSTVVECVKKPKHIKEKTFLRVVHLAKNAFKKIDLGLTRVGSSKASELNTGSKLTYTFKHPSRDQPQVNVNETNQSLPVEYYQIKDRPILCRERQLSRVDPCSPVKNFSYVCYYRIGFAEPPTIAEMDRDLKKLRNGSDSDETLLTNVYINKKPVEKPPTEFSLKPVIAIGTVSVLTIISIIICCCCCCSRRPPRRRMRPRRRGHVDSNSSIGTNIS